MPLGTSNQTVTTGANFIPEIWSPLVIKATEANLVLWNRTWDWSEDNGDIIHSPNVSNLTANTKTAGSQVTLNAPTEDVTNLTVSTHRECSFLIEDILKAQSKYPLSKYYTDKAGYAIAQVMDTAVSTNFANFSQFVGVAGSPLGDAQILDAIEYLDLADVPDDGGRCAVIHPSQKNAIFKIDKFVRADFSGNGPSKILTKGQIGDIYGVMFYVTTNLSTSSGARLNAMFHKEAIMTGVSYGPRTQGDYILEYLANLVVVDVVYGTGESRDAFGVWMRS